MPSSNPALALIILFAVAAIVSLAFARRLRASLRQRETEIGQLRVAREQIAQLRSTEVSDLTDKLRGAERELAVAATWNASHRAELEAGQAECSEHRSELVRVRTENGRLAEERDRLAATLEAERKATVEKISLLQELEGRLKDAFLSLSSQALQANNRSFVDLAKVSLSEFQALARADLDARHDSIDQLVAPVQVGLKLVGEKLHEIDRERAATHSSLQQHLLTVAEGQRELSRETRLLTNALRTPHVRGRWGELQLRRVVELAGMVEHCDFIEQPTIASENGVTRPDLVVQLPGNKSIVVDSKVPLTAYLDALEPNDERERARLLDLHAKQVRDHIAALASKGYAQQFSEAPDFVVLFLPGEAFFSVACERDPGIIEFAVQRGVIPATPTTLITVLKAVAYGWQQERIARNSEQIRDLGVELYGRIRVLAEHVAKIRRGLEAAVLAYNSAVGALESRVLPSARRFNELGVTRGEGIEALEAVEQFPRVPVRAELRVAEASTDIPNGISPTFDG
jgi:DNA recombination protein RmuC